MDSQLVINEAVTVQIALYVITATLQLTAYLFPQQSYVKDGFTFNFIVIGGGTAGSIVASRLSEDCNVKVLLIEAGGDAPIQVMKPSLLGYLPFSPQEFNYTSQDDGYTLRCHRNKVLDLTSGRVLGGGSSVNYMFYMRGNRADYRRWAKIAKDDTWLWQNVLPYFKKFERLEDPAILNSLDRKYHGTKGYVGLNRQTDEIANKYLESFKELGNDIVLDLSGAKDYGFTQPLYTLADGVRQSTGYCYLSPAKDRSNLYVLKNTLATKILFDEEKKATGITVLTENNETLIFNAETEVILSAGALNSAKLLMLSGVGPANDLRLLNIDVVADLPVGRSLQDHVTVPISHQVQYNTTKVGPQDPSLYPFTTVFGLSALNKSQERPAYGVEAYLLPPYSKLPIQFFSFIYRYDFSVGQLLNDITKDRNTILSLIIDLHPKSKGKVCLRSAKPTDPPLVYTGYLSDEEDFENLIKYVEDYMRIVHTTYFKESHAVYTNLAYEKCGYFEIGSRQYWRCYILCMINSIFDFSGTCPMGSVVDSRLRVFGVRGLRVVDASVMPDTLSGTINGPVMMIGEKASDMIKEDNSFLFLKTPYENDFNEDFDTCQ